MEKNLAFCSVCTLNHTSFAATLSDSLRKAGHDQPHYVLVIDLEPKNFKLIESFGFNTIYLSQLNVPNINKLIKKYSAFELCNVLRPFFFEWILNNKKNTDYLIYLDCDIFVYKKFTEILTFFKLNKDKSIAITPHIFDNKLFSKSQNYSKERKYMSVGLYNSGFYALKNDKNARVFLNWHQKEMIDYGYNAKNSQMFVDQKILDFAPVIFDFVAIYKNDNYNLAYWNFQPNKFDLSKLVFFHFSQLRIINQNIKDSYLCEISLKSNATLQRLVGQYWKILKNNKYEEYISIRYGLLEKYCPPELSFIDPVKYTNEELLKCKKELNEIHNSQGWKLLLGLYSIKDMVNNKTYKLKQILKKLLSLRYRLPQFLKKHPKHHINSSSKKILLIDHSYHAKTLSTVFIADILKQQFDVELLWEDSWQGKPYPDVSFIDNSYLSVIFFQDLPSPEIYNKINNDNKVLIPMYDHSGGFPKSWWESYPKLKVINFSSTLHQKLKAWGLETIYVQRFPKPEAFHPGKPNKTFFYSRSEKINFELVKKLFGKYKTSIHIHKTMDPGQTFSKLTKSDENKYDVTYSEWFKTKDEQWEAAKDKGIFIAPREFEGIGQGFIEAMARGKAVIAPNNPTMNEYIVHNKTGYLYDVYNPTPIDLSNILQVQKNAYNYIVSGWEKWQNNQKDIIKFIKGN